MRLKKKKNHLQRITWLRAKFTMLAFTFVCIPVNSNDENISLFDKCSQDLDSSRNSCPCPRVLMGRAGTGVPSLGGLGLVTHRPERWNDLHWHLLSLLSAASSPLPCWNWGFLWLLGHHYWFHNSFELLMSFFFFFFHSLQINNLRYLCWLSCLFPL